MYRAQYLAIIGIIFVNTSIADKQGIETYENGGTISLDIYHARSRIGQRKSMLREFIWDHWVKKARGVICVRTWTIEGEAGRAEYWIDLDQNGNLYLKTIFHRANPRESGSNDPDAQTSSISSFTVHNVERVAPKSDVVLEVSDNRGPNAYELLLKGDDNIAADRL